MLGLDWLEAVLTELIDSDLELLVPEVRLELLDTLDLDWLDSLRSDCELRELSDCEEALDRLRLLELSLPELLLLSLDIETLEAETVLALAVVRVLAELGVSRIVESELELESLLGVLALDWLEMEFDSELELELLLAVWVEAVDWVSLEADTVDTELAVLAVLALDCDDSDWLDRELWLDTDWVERLWLDRLRLDRLESENGLSLELEELELAVLAVLAVERSEELELLWLLPVLIELSELALWVETLE